MNDLRLQANSPSHVLTSTTFYHKYIGKVRKSREIRRLKINNKKERE